MRGVLNIEAWHVGLQVYKYLYGVEDTIKLTML